MAKIKKLSSANRAWNVVRLAMLWARKGSLIKRRLVMDLHLASNYLKALKRNSKDSIKYYGEHELSFDETPMIQVKMYRPTSMRFRIPCFTPGDDEVVDFDCDDDDDDRFNRKYVIEDAIAAGEEEICGDHNDEGYEQIDERADKFIAEFYAQMRLQRQISRLEYQ